MPPQDPVAPIIESGPADDPGFIQLVGRVVGEELEAKAVHGLFLIRISNWFDDKWRNFSGIGRAAYGHFTGLAAADPDTTLTAIHRDRSKSTFPPFTPNRVLSQTFYRKAEHGAYVLEQDGPWVHPGSRKRSSANLHQRITTHNNSSLFVWFSSNTLTNRRGSLLVYRACGTSITTWYAAFSFDGKCRVVKTLGITRQVVVKWLEREAPVLGPVESHRGEASVL